MLLTASITAIIVGVTVVLLMAFVLCLCTIRYPISSQHTPLLTQETQDLEAASPGYSRYIRVLEIYSHI